MSLELENVGLTIGGQTILKNISFRLEPGELLVVLGNSGAGKSKLLEVVAGLVTEPVGRVEYGGRSLEGLGPQERSVGLVFQDYALFPHLTAAENILFGLKCRRAPRAEQVKWLKAVTAELKIDHLLERYPTELSGGQQQRVALARCMVLRPEILLLDEPLSALDAATRERLALLIKRIQDKFGVTMLYVTHDHTEARLMADRILVLEGGEMVQLGTPEMIFDRPRNRFVAHFTATRNILPGRITERRESAGRVQVEFAGIRVEAASFPDRDELVWVCMRPEFFHLGMSRETGGEENLIPGCRVRRLLPQTGAVMQVEFEAGPEQERLLACTFGPIAADLGPGDRVDLKIAATHVHCLPRRAEDIYCR